MENPDMASYYRIERVLPAEGVRRVWSAGLFENNEETSRVLLLVDPYHKSEHLVQAVWLTQDCHSCRDVGMAMVSNPAEDSQGLPILNLYVDYDHRNQGIGQALLSEVLAAYPKNQLAAYYTLDSVRLYAPHNLPPAEIFRSSLSSSSSLDDLRHRQVELTLAARAQRDQEDPRLVRRLGI